MTGSVKKIQYTSIGAGNDFLSEDFVRIFDGYVSGFYSEKSKLNYKNKVLTLLKSTAGSDLRPKDFVEITESDVRHYFSILEEKGRKLCDLKTKLSIFRSVARAVDSELGTDTAKAFAGMQFEPLDMDIKLSDLPHYGKDIDVLLSYLKSVGDKVLFCAVAIAIETGLGSAEICKIEYNTLRVSSDGKPFVKFKVLGEYRNLLLRDDTAKLLGEIGTMRGNYRQDDVVFRNRYGDPLTEKMLQSHLHDACVKAGLKKGFTFEKLRKLALAEMLKGGAPVEELKKQFNISDFWFFRFDPAVKDMSKTAASYNHVTIRW